MASLSFNIYGYQIKITGFDFPLNELKVTRDFKFFAANALESVDLEIKIQKLNDYKLQGFPIGRTSMCQVRQLSISRRQLVYRKNDQILALVSDNSATSPRRIEIKAANAEIIDDILYFLINSCSGEYLDKSGLMRIHALSYRSNVKGGLVYGFPGAGKSTVAMGLLENESVQIFSDEISIFDIEKHLLLPFPIRLAVTDVKNTTGLSTKFTYFFNTKFLVDLDNEKIAKSRALTHFHFLDVSKKPALYYLCCIFLGIGLIQMWEYLFRFNNFPSLYRIAINRIKLCRQLRSYNLNFLDRNLTLEKKLKILL